MIAAAGEVSKYGPNPGGDTAIALFFSFATLTVTILICHLGEILAEQFHTRHVPACNFDHDRSTCCNAATLSLPNVVQPTLIEADDDHDWEAMLSRLTEHHAGDRITRDVVDASPG